MRGGLLGFLLRSVEERDLDDLLSLTSQFYVMNLPPKRDVLKEKIARSVESFSGKIKDRAKTEYLLVVEDNETNRVVGSSLIIGKHGTKSNPHTAFKIQREEKFSHDLGIGFVHQVLNMTQDTSGPTEIGGLLVDASYRRRPEKIGRQISMVRFVYMGYFPDRFEKKILCELTPPLTSEGRSEFWEALGRRFTGLPYQEADLISQNHKEFIRSLFPATPIYLSLLSAEARLVVGRVGETTKPAQHLLESLGFQYLHEVDPFDGGPHYGADTADIPLVRQGKHCKIAAADKVKFEKLGLVGTVRNGAFRGCQTLYEKEGSFAKLPDTTLELIGSKVGEEIFLSPLV